MNDRARVTVITGSALLAVLAFHILLFLALMRYSSVLVIPDQQKIRDTIPLLMQQRQPTPTFPPQIPAAQMPAQATQPTRPQPVATVAQPQQSQQQIPHMEEITVGRRAGNAKQDPEHTTVPPKGQGGQQIAQEKIAENTSNEPLRQAQGERVREQLKVESKDTIHDTSRHNHPELTNHPELVEGRGEGREPVEGRTENLSTSGRIVRASKSRGQTNSTQRLPTTQERLTLASFATQSLGTSKGIAHNLDGKEAEGMDSSTVFGDLRYKSYADAVWKEIRNAFNIAQMYGLPKSVQQEAIREKRAVGIYITLNKDGTLETKLINSSGDPFIDNFVVKALNNVGMLPPFPKSLNKEHIGFSVMYHFSNDFTPDDSINKFQTW